MDGSAGTQLVWLTSSWFAALPARMNLESEGTSEEYDDATKRLLIFVDGFLRR